MSRAGDLLVRWATRWDREVLLKLLAELAAMHGVEVEREALDEAFEFALKNPDRVRFCVAERDRVILGLASLHDGYSTWRAKAFGEVQDVFVTEEARRTGVATGLLEFLVAEARRRGYCRLNLDVKAGNEGARAFYEAFGLTGTGCVVYEMGLEEEG